MAEAETTSADSQSPQKVMVWVEDDAGTISRGQADSISTSGARVRLAGTPAFATGDEVALRMCFEPGAPTIATTARVSWLRVVGDAAECALEWTAPQPQRAALDAWLASAA
jgi:hypothetical protein